MRKYYPPAEVVINEHWFKIVLVGRRSGEKEVAYTSAKNLDEAKTIANGCVPGDFVQSVKEIPYEQVAAEVEKSLISQWVRANP